MSLSYRNKIRISSAAKKTDSAELATAKLRMRLAKDGSLEYYAARGDIRRIKEKEQADAHRD